MSIIKIKDKLNMKFATIDFIITIGILVSTIIVILKLILGNTANPVLSNMIPFSDFTDVLKYSVGKGETYTIGNYFPFTYIFMGFLEIICFNNYIVLYLVLFIVFLIGCFYFCKYITKVNYIYIIIFILLQFPILFTFQRGNIEFISLLICMFFYILYINKKYDYAAIILSFAICLKLYPALLALLLISKKEYKAFFLCTFLSIGITRNKLLNAV